MALVCAIVGDVSAKSLSQQVWLFALPKTLVKSSPSTGPTVASLRREFSGSLTPRADPGGNDSSGLQIDIARYSSCCPEDTEVDWAFSTAAL